MPLNLRGRHLLTLTHHTEQEILHLVDLAADLKGAKRTGTERPLLGGKAIALIFEKTSTRTRCAFEVAAYDQGAHVTFLDPASSQIGHKESIHDTAKVLGRMYDAIQYRGSAQSTVEQLARHAGVPVLNGLTDEWHPTQSLGTARGTEAVIDKDLAAALLAEQLAADLLVIATDVDGVYRDFGTPRAARVGSVKTAQLSSMPLPAGSMGPKVEAACRFVDRTGGRAVIGSLDDIVELVAGTAGTRVVAAVADPAQPADSGGDRAPAP